MDTRTTRTNRGATLGWTVAGLALIAYPALRPRGPETGTAGAETFAATAWPVSHALAMVGFVAIAFSLRAVRSRGEVPMWISVALLLPYYGAEAYGLNAVGVYAVENGHPAVLAVADSFRYAVLPGATFVAGLLVLAVVGVMVARGSWAAGGPARIGGVLAAAGLVTYLPQFFGSPELRIAHGIVVGCGFLLIAFGSRDVRPLR